MLLFIFCRVFGDASMQININSFLRLYILYRFTSTRLLKGNGKAQHKERMKKIYYFLILLFAASVIFTGCRSDDDDPITDYPDYPEYPKEPDYYIVVEDEKMLEQDVYADEVEGESGVRFTTLAPWTSSITETTTTATRNAVDWVSISPEYGEAGEHEIFIRLEPNFSGSNRSAIIAIESGSMIIEIRITQMGVTEEGYEPVNPEDHSIIRAENIGGANTDKVVTVRAIVWPDDGGGKYFIVDEASFENNGFKLKLSDIPDSYLSPLDLGFFDGTTISDKNVRISEDGVGLMAFDSNGDVIGYFDFVDYEVYASAFWLYADRDVTIKGARKEDGWESVVDLNLRKGWNIFYIYDTWTPNIDSWRITTQKPNNVNLRWRFIEGRDCDWGFEDWSSRSATTRATENRMSFFRR